MQSWLCTLYSAELSDANLNFWGAEFIFIYLFKVL